MINRAGKITILTFALLGLSTAFGANVTLGTADAANCYPFNCNDSGSAKGQSIDYQQVFAASSFGSSPISITDITFSDTYLTQVLFPSVPLLSGTYAFSFAYTSAAVNGLSGTLANNITSGKATFLVDSNDPGEAAGFTTLKFTGTTPFVYNPLTGNLLLDIAVTNQANVSSASYSPFVNGFDADDTAAVTSRAFAVGTSAGAADSTGLVTTFGFTTISTPEPSTYALLGGGLLALIAGKRRKALSGAALALMAVAGLNAQPINIKPRTIAVPLHTVGGTPVSFPNGLVTPVNIPTFTRNYVGAPQIWVGTDPATSNITTTVTTPVIPVVLVLNNGAGPAFDPTRKLNTAPPGSGLSAMFGTVASPLFQNATFTTGGTTVGTNTQFGDAIMRATFWDSVSTVSPNWHTRLQFQIKPTITLNVPTASGSVSGPFALVDINWLGAQLDALAPNYGATNFPIFLVYEVLQYSGSSCCILGYHTALQTSPSTIQTYAMGTYLDPFQIGGGANDISVLSHEVSEWLNDPYVNNTVPAWPAPFSFIPPGPPYDNTQCQNNLETGDPIEDRSDPNVVVFHATTFGRQYTMQNEALAPWFLQVTPSFSVNGNYTYLGAIDSEFSHPAPACGVTPAAIAQ